MQDPLALWRNKDSLTVNEAARLVHDIPGNRSYGAPAKLSDARRDEYDMVKATLACLSTAIEANTLKASAVHGERAAERGVNWVTREPTYSPAARWLDTERTTIHRDVLREWCEANELRPLILFGDADKPLGTTERENLLRLIGVLCELAGIDLRNDTKGHAEARCLIGPMDKRNVRIGAETVAKQIAAARELIAPKGPEQLQSDSNSKRSRSSSK